MGGKREKRKSIGRRGRDGIQQGIETGRGMLFSSFAMASTFGNKEGAFQFMEWYLDLDDVIKVIQNRATLFMNEK